MRIERDVNGSTIITHSPVLISAVLGGLTVVVLVTLVAPLVQTPRRYETLYVGLIALVFLLAFAHFMWERVRFELDPRRRVIVWRRQRLFAGTTGGNIPFDDVIDVVTQTMTSSDNFSRLTRVALVTRDGRIPLVNVYGGNSERVTRTIREVVGPDRSGHGIQINAD